MIQFEKNLITFCRSCQSLCRIWVEREFVWFEFKQIISTCAGLFSYQKKSLNNSHFVHTTIKFSISLSIFIFLLIDASLQRIRYNLWLVYSSKRKWNKRLKCSSLCCWYRPQATNKKKSSKTQSQRVIPTRTHQQQHQANGGERKVSEQTNERENEEWNNIGWIPLVETY